MNTFSQEPANSSLRMIFLDFDGVLHPVSKIELLDGVVPPSPAQYAKDNGLFCYLKDLAELLADHQDVILMVHSSWRHHVENPEMRVLLGDLGHLYGGFTDRSLSRYASIEMAIERSEATDVLILDDNPTEFLSDCKELVLCHPELGISDERTKSIVHDWLLTTSPTARPC